MGQREQSVDFPQENRIIRALILRSSRTSWSTERRLSKRTLRRWRWRSRSSRRRSKSRLLFPVWFTRCSTSWLVLHCSIEILLGFLRGVKAIVFQKHYSFFRRKHENETGEDLTNFVQHFVEVIVNFLWGFRWNGTTARKSVRCKKGMLEQMDHGMK